MELMVNFAITLSACHFLTLLLVSVSGQRISCHTSGSVYEKESASLTCDYPKDLKTLGNGFYIYRYPLEGGDPDVPAICDFENEYLSCETLPGFDVRVQGQRMTLNISSAQQTHAGRYVCHVLQPEENVQTGECALLVQRRDRNQRVDCHAVSVPLGQQFTAIMCFAPQSLTGNNITIERLEPSKSTEEKIIRCIIGTNTCETRNLGYEFSVHETTSAGLKVMVAVVNRDGQYTCKVDGKDMETLTCSVTIREDKQIDTVNETSPSSQSPILITRVLLGIVVILLAVAISVAVCLCVRYLKRCSRRNYSPDNDVNRDKQSSNPKEGKSKEEKGNENNNDDNAARVEKQQFIPSPTNTCQ